MVERVKGCMDPSLPKNSVLSKSVKELADRKYSKVCMRYHENYHSPSFPMSGERVPPAGVLNSSTSFRPFDPEKV